MAWAIVSRKRRVEGDLESPPSIGDRHSADPDTERLGRDIPVQPGVERRAVQMPMTTERDPDDPEILKPPPNLRRRLRRMMRALGVQTFSSLTRRIVILNL